MTYILKNGIYANYRLYRAEEFRNRIKLIQCFKCQKFGHIAKNCKSSPRCSQCGGEHKIENGKMEKCTANTKKCPNCGGQHSSSYGGCAKIKNKIKEIKEKLSSKVKTNVSYCEASAKN